MSKQSEVLLEELINESDEDFVAFDEAVSELADKLGVKEKTAGSYVYTSDVCEVVNEAGFRTVKAKTAAGVKRDELHSDDVEFPAGAPSGDFYYSLEKLEKDGHPLIPESKGYFAREIIGNKTDLQLLTRKLSRNTPSGQKHVLLEGLPGTGKNAMVREVCAKTNRPMIRIPCSKDIRYEDVVGHYAPNEDADGPSFVWHDGLLTMAWRYGWVVVFDELNMAGGDITSALHQATEGVGDNQLVIRQTGEVVEPHPETRVVATMNPYGHAGTKQLNEAFESRFSRMKVPYLDAEAEKMVLFNEVDGLEAREDDVEKLIDFASRLRNQYLSDELNIVVTTRELIKVCDHLPDDFLTVEEAIKHEIGSMLDEMDSTAFEATIDKVF